MPKPFSIPSSPPVQKPQPLPLAGTFHWYDVLKGQTLSIIARDVLGDLKRYKELAALNQDLLPDPNKLEVGQRIRLPFASPRVPKPPVHPPSLPTPPAASDHWSAPTTTGGPVRGLFWGDAHPGEIALTFDDGPSSTTTPAILAALKARQVKATFFVLGQNARRCPELIRQIVAQGHTLGNHSFDHARLTTLSATALRAELEDTQKAVDAALGFHYELTQVRPPYGEVNDQVRNTVRDAGDVAVLWNIDSNDWRYPNDDAKILDNVFSGPDSVYGRGGVVLMHDIHPQTTRVLGQIIDRLRREKFRFTDTDALLEKKYPAGPPHVG